MRNERINLTPGNCRDLKPRAKEYFILDKNCPGLWLRVFPSGFKWNKPTVFSKSPALWNNKINGYKKNILVIFKIFNN